jgi:CRISPR system Cascade subunit CasA
VLLYPGPGGDTVVDSTITWAFRELVPENGRDPYLIYEVRDGVPRPCAAKAERALWRDLDALVLVDRGTGTRPAILDGLEHEIPEEIAEAFRVEAYGFDQDGQTRDRTYFGGSTPELLPFLKTSGDREEYTLARYAGDARKAAEKAADRLLYALRVAWRDYVSPPGDKPGRPEKPGSEKDRGPWPNAAKGAYWPRAEGEFWRLLDTDDRPPPMRSFGRLALAVYDDLTGRVAATPKGAKAREAARGLILKLLADAGAPAR